SSAALSLTEATTRMLAQHPELHQYAAQSKALATDSELARQSAPFSLGLETSEIGGTGEYKGVSSAETTLSVSSLIETGGKRERRVRLSATKLELANLEREAATRTLISQLTQAYNTTLANQELCRYAEDTVALSQEAYGVVQERVEKAVSPSAVDSRAKVDKMQETIDLYNSEAESDINQHSLAMTMGQA